MSQKTPEPLPLFVSKAKTCGTQGRLGDKFVKLKDKRNERMNRKFCKNNGQKKHVSLELTPKILQRKVAKEKYCFFQEMFFQKLAAKYLFQKTNFSWNVLENMSKKITARHPCHGGFSHRGLPHRRRRKALVPRVPRVPRVRRKRNCLFCMEENVSETFWIFLGFSCLSELWMMTKIWKHNINI